MDAVVARWGSKDARREVERWCGDGQPRPAVSIGGNARARQVHALARGVHAAAWRDSGCVREQLRLRGVQVASLDVRGDAYAWVRRGPRLA